MPSPDSIITAQLVITRVFTADGDDAICVEAPEQISQIEAIGLLELAKLRMLEEED